MKLKTKIFSFGTMVTVTAPIMIVVSCGNDDSINWNINDEINNQTPNIKFDIHNSLILEGKDRHGTFRLNFSPNVQSLLAKAKYVKKLEVKYFRDGSKAKWKDVSLDVPQDLSNYDEIRITLIPKQGYLINGKDKYIFETSKIGTVSSDVFQFGSDFDWFKPATKSISTPGVVSVDSLNHKLILNFNQYNHDIKMNELTFTIAKELGYLFSETKILKSFTDVVTKPDGTKIQPTNALLLEDIYNSLVKAKTLAIDKLEINYKTKTEIIDLKYVLDGVEKGEAFIKPFKDSKLENGEKLTNIFIGAPATPEFLDKYKDIAIPLTDKLLSLISGMESDKKALEFFPELAVNYGRVFEKIINSPLTVEWRGDKNIRPRAIDSLPQIFMATLFRK